MISPLRRRHRWMTLVLGFAALAILVLALAKRPAEPLMERLPAALTEAGP